MATIQPFVWMKDKHGHKGDDGFQTLHENLEFTRVPCVGEFVNIGDDTGGQAADYKVLLVIHAPHKPSGVDAEIYMERVFWPGAITAEDERLKKSPPDRSELPPKEAKPSGSVESATADEVQTDPEAWEGKEVVVTLKGQKPPLKGVLQVMMGSFIVGGAMVHDDQVKSISKLKHIDW